MERRNPRESGVVLVLALVLMIGLLAFTAVSVDLAKSHATVNRSEELIFSAKQIAESAFAEALARLKEGGQVSPVSGDGTNPEWVRFGEGEYHYSTVHDAAANVSTITAWGRVPVTGNPSGTLVSPDEPGWDGSGYVVQGLEVSVLNRRYVPNSPAYFGNGGFEKPMGGFLWTKSVDPFDPSTWTYVTSGPRSYQHSSVPFLVNALDHPPDYLYNGGAPSPAGPGIHPYKLFTTQNPIGQLNVRAWFENSAGPTSDPLSNVTPSMTLANFSLDPTSPDYAFNVDSSLPDVQDFAWALWNQYGSSVVKTTKLKGGDQSGVLGDLSDPKIVFVTGSLNVPSSQTLRGAGILVIRDDFDPNIDTNNRPAQSAGLTVNGTLEWSGLVIVSGWSPTIDVRPGGALRIVGALMAEDSVMSGGEISLNSSSITMKVMDTLELRYCSQFFAPGGMLYDMLPMLRREVIASRERYAD